MSRGLYDTRCLYSSYFFFFNDTATTEIYTLSLHDALPIYEVASTRLSSNSDFVKLWTGLTKSRSEEHTSELQSQSNLVCRLLLEKKKKILHDVHHTIHPHTLFERHVR